MAKKRTQIHTVCCTTSSIKQLLNLRNHIVLMTNLSQLPRSFTYIRRFTSGDHLRTKLFWRCCRCFVALCHNLRELQSICEFLRDSNHCRREKSTRFNTWRKLRLQVQGSLMTRLIRAGESDDDCYISREQWDGKAQQQRSMENSQLWCSDAESRRYLTIGIRIFARCYRAVRHVNNFRELK